MENLLKILMIPDCQVKPGVDLRFLSRIGQYAAAKKPDVIVNIGDFADMPSLSSFDKGKKSFEGRRYTKDIESTRKGMDMLMEPIHKAAKESDWRPRLVMTLGNHEHRIVRAAEFQAELDGLISINDLQYERHGWEVYPFLKPVKIAGVMFAHYFTSGVMGRPVSSARAMLTKKMMSCVMGHVQTLDVANAHTADGRRLTGIIAGAAYEHHEDYLGPQGNLHYRGIHMLHDVRNGEFDLMSVSNRYLRRSFP